MEKSEDEEERKVWRHPQSLDRSFSLLQDIRNWSQFQSAFDVSVTAFDLRDNESKTDVDPHSGHLF